MKFGQQLRFQRRHYEAVASIPAEAKSLEERSYISDPTDKRVWITQQLVLLFARDNPRFDRERFLRACGVEP